ncbi:MAG: hypothetical protein KC492_12445, partial [Myxococcales bacterium]|nr:hypothetical protein [Myxococcales bacterium]
AEGAKLIAPENPLVIPGGKRRETTIFVVAPEGLFVGGKRDVDFKISDGKGFERTFPYKLLGPGGEK